MRQRSLAEILAELRSSRGLSQEQLAEQSGISVRAIGEIERGATRRPHRETLRALAGALGLTQAAQDAFARTARTAPPPDTRRRVCLSVDGVNNSNYRRLVQNPCYGFINERFQPN